MKIRLTYTVPARDRKMVKEWFQEGDDEAISEYAECNLNVKSVSVSSLELRGNG